jgi:predicted  nucleic acid-binding Zn-ribbon protein
MMTSEEMQQKIEFIIDHLVHSETRMAKLEDVVLRLANSIEKRMSNQEDKITMLIDAQIKTNEQVATLADSLAQTDERLAALADSLAHTDGKLNALIDIIREGRNGK